MAALQLLVVEDPLGAFKNAADWLRAQGCQVTTRSLGEDWCTLAANRPPDVLVFDLGTHARAAAAGAALSEATGALAIPVLALLAPSTLASASTPVPLGLDEVLRKPCHLADLLQRLEALHRNRRATCLTGDVLECQGIRIDQLRHRAFAAAAELRLTPTEFKLLATLVGQPGRVFTRAQLIELVMGTATVILDRTIDVHVKTLRRKLGALNTLIETVPRVGGEER